MGRPARRPMRVLPAGRLWTIGMFESLQTKLNAVFEKLAARGRLTEAGRGRRAARGAPGAARSRRQLQGRQAARRARARAGDRRRGDEEPHARRSRSSRSSTRSCSRRWAKPRKLDLSGHAAARDHAGRPAGLRQDDDGRQAGADAAQAGQARCWSRPTPTARPPSRSSRCSASRSTSRCSARARRCRRPRSCATALQRGRETRDGRGDPGHGRPPADQRRHDGRAGADQGDREAARRSCSWPMR